MDKLDAVNNLLRLIGTRKVTSVTIQHPDVSDAVDVIDDWIKKCLDRGWWFNLMENVTIQPDSGKNITFPSNVLRFEYADADQKRRYPLLAKRNNRLVNSATNSTSFEEALKFHLYITLEFDDLPHTAQQYITYSAGAEFVRDKIEDTAKENKLWVLANEQYAELDAEEMRQQRYNMFNTPAIADVRRGRRPFLGIGRLS